MANFYWTNPDNYKVILINQLIPQPSCITGLHQHHVNLDYAPASCNAVTCTSEYIIVAQHLSPHLHLHTWRGEHEDTIDIRQLCNLQPKIQVSVIVILCSTWHLYLRIWHDHHNCTTMPTVLHFTIVYYHLIIWAFLSRNVDIFFLVYTKSVIFFWHEIKQNSF